MRALDTMGLIGIRQVNSVDFVKSAFQVYRSGDVLVILKHSDSGLDLKEEIIPKTGGGWLDLKQEVIHENRPAQIVFTSGTEGAPKAILLSHQALADVVVRLNGIMKLDETVREYIGVPVTYSFGLGRCRAVAAVGGKCYLPENGFNPAELARMIAADEINAISAVPSLWRTLLVQPKIIGGLGGKVKWIEIGSQYMSRAEKEQMKALFPNAVIIQHYGLTEASRTTFLNISETEGELLESVGQVTGNVNIKLSSDGRIMIRGAHLASCQIVGAVTKELVDADGWFTTGDFGRLDNDHLYFGGRADDLINCAGIKVNPDLLQEKINRRLNIENRVAVCRIDDALRGEGFFVAIESDSGIDINKVRGATIDELLLLGINANSSVKVQEVARIPRTDTEKVRRKELSTLYSNTPVEKKKPSLQNEGNSILNLYAQIFVGADIKTEDSFRSLGGDSLNYVQMLMSLETRFGFAPTDWDKMSIEHLEKLKRIDKSSIYSWLDTTVFLRAIAIMGVVAVHSGASWFGGATSLLFSLIGYNLARFKSKACFDGDIWPWIKTYSIIILVPYYVLLVIYQVNNKSFGIEEFLLYGNLIHTNITVFFPFWFVQVLFQCMIVIGLIFSVPVLRRYASSSPATFSYSMLAIFIAIRVIFPQYWIEGSINLSPIRHMAFLWLGWSLYFIENFQQRLIICLIGVCFPFVDTGLIWGFDFQSPQMGLSGPTKWLVIGSIFLAFVPRVPVPSFAKKTTDDIAAATFYIFVFNGMVIKVLEKVVRLESAFWIFVLTMIGSVLIWWALEKLRLISKAQALMSGRRIQE